MRHHMFKPAAATVVLAAAAVVLTGGAATPGGAAAGPAPLGLAAVPAAAASPAIGAQARAGAGALGAAPITMAGGVSRMSVPLVTGGHVGVSMAAGGVLSVTAGPGQDGIGPAVVHRDGVGHMFVVPVFALSLVGGVLSPSLFDVSALAADHITGRARVPVRLRFAAGEPVAAPPGVAITAVHGRSATGYVTAASARVFGAAVGRQARAAARTGVLFGNLATVSLAAGPAESAALPRLKLHTLRITVTNLAGLADPHPVILLANTDDALLTPNHGFVPNHHGVGTVRVPAGDYSVNVGFFDGPAHHPAGAHIVQVNDFTVPASSAVTTVHVRERSATAQVLVTTPRPVAGGQGLVLMFDRVSMKGGALEDGYLLLAGQGAPTGIFVSPQPPAKVGKLRYLAWWLAAGPATGLRYAYSVVGFSGEKIPGKERFAIHPNQVATVREHFSADPASAGLNPAYLSSAPYDPTLRCACRAPGGLTTLAGGAIAPMPGNLILYLVAPPGEQWLQQAGTPARTTLTADPHTFQAGRSYSIPWVHGPLAPRFGQHTGPWACQACAAGHTLSLVFSPAGDSQPDHVIPGPPQTSASGPPASRFTLFRNGHKLLSVPHAFGAVIRDAPPRPATYRAVLTDDLSHLRGFSQSTHTTTDLTVNYIPGSGAPLPETDSCAGQAATTPCRILPVLTLNYQLATTENNASTSATQVLHLQAAHLSYDGHGSAAPITSAKVMVSFDGGNTWKPAHLTGGNGSYTATWTNPAPKPGVHPSLKVTATDNAGNTITQTIANAYTLGPLH